MGFSIDEKRAFRFAEEIKSKEAEENASEKAESAVADKEGGQAEGKALSVRKKMRKLLLLHVATVKTKDMRVHVHFTNWHSKLALPLNEQTP